MCMVEMDILSSDVHQSTPRLICCAHACDMHTFVCMPNKVPRHACIFACSYMHVLMLYGYYIMGSSLSKEVAELSYDCDESKESVAKMNDEKTDAGVCKEYAKLEQMIKARNKYVDRKMKNLEDDKVYLEKQIQNLKRRITTLEQEIERKIDRKDREKRKEDEMRKRVRIEEEERENMREELRGKKRRM